MVKSDEERLREILLVQAVQNGDNEKFGDLWSMYYERMERWASYWARGQNYEDRKDFISESVSEVGIKVFDKLMKEKQPRDPAKFGGFLRACVINYCIDRIRRKAVEMKRRSDWGFKPGPDRNAVALANCIKEQTYADSRIKPRDLAILKLRFFEKQLELQTIAEVLPENIDHVKYVIKKFKTEQALKYRKKCLEKLPLNDFAASL